MIRIDSVVHCHSVHVFPDSSLGLFPKIVNQSVLIHHNQTSITLKHNYIIKVYAPACRGARVIGQSTEMPCPYYHRVFLIDFSITKQTIVAICQRPLKRVKSESFLSSSFERPRSSRQSLKEHTSSSLRSRNSPALQTCYICNITAREQFR